jgi:formamidopyrimidine-DNA glycosylase
MPELPEVEIVRRGLEPMMLGQQFVGVEQRRPDLRFPFPAGFATRLEGQTITAVRRRAKYLIVDLSGGEALVMHLGMSGRFTIQPGVSQSPQEFGGYVYDTGAYPQHDHVVFGLSNQSRITYNDPRRFGFMLLVPQAELPTHPLFASMGIEPLGPDLTALYLAKRAQGKRVALKSFLLDQRIIAGLGNIYVCEALHHAGLSPRRLASTLGLRNGGPADRTARLIAVIPDVLHQALNAGGSSLRDYRHTDGTSGDFQRAFAVYGREGEPCKRSSCNGTVARIVQAQRSTFYCASCQR